MIPRFSRTNIAAREAASAAYSECTTRCAPSRSVNLRRRKLAGTRWAGARLRRRGRLLDFRRLLALHWHDAPERAAVRPESRWAALPGSWRERRSPPGSKYGHEHVSADLAEWVRAIGNQRRLSRA